jgi:hypothetical protein
MYTSKIVYISLRLFLRLRKSYNFPIACNIDEKTALTTIFEQRSPLGIVDDMSQRVSE